MCPFQQFLVGTHGSECCRRIEGSSSLLFSSSAAGSDLLEGGRRGNSLINIPGLFRMRIAKATAQTGGEGRAEGGWLLNRQR